MSGFLTTINKERNGIHVKNLESSISKRDGRKGFPQSTSSSEKFSTVILVNVLRVNTQRLNFRQPLGYPLNAGNKSPKGRIRANMQQDD